MSLQQAMIAQSFRRQTLTPGKIEQGFLYYRLPSDDISGKTVGISIKATDSETMENSPPLRFMTIFRFSEFTATFRAPYLIVPSILAGMLVRWKGIWVCLILHLIVAAILEAFGR